MTKKPVVLVAAFLCIVLSLSVPALAAPQDVKVDRSQWDAITSGAGYSTKGIQVNVQNIVDHMKTWDNIFGYMQTYLGHISTASKNMDSVLGTVRTYVKNISDLMGGPGGFRQLVDDVRYMRNNPPGGGSGSSNDYTHLLSMIQDSNHDIDLKTIAIAADTSSIADSVPIIQNALFAKWHPQRPPASVAELVAMVWRQLEIDLHGYAVDNGVKQQVTIGSLVADLRNSLANKVDQEIRDNVSEDANAYKDHFSTKPNKDNIGGMSGVSDGASKWFSTDVSIADAGGMFDQFDQNLAGWFSGTTANQISVGGADAAFYRDFDYYVAPDTPDLDSWLDEAHRIAGGLSG